MNRAKLFGKDTVTSEEAVEFIGNVLESSTEYSVIAMDLDGKIALWNEGARRIYGYEPGEVVGKDQQPQGVMLARMRPLPQVVSSVSV